MAHDFNNLLSVIINAAAFAAERVHDPEAASDISQIQEAARRAADLVRQLMLYTRQDGEAETVQVDEVVASTVALMRRLLEEHLEVVCNLRCGEAAVEVSRSRLEQVLSNMLVNARDALPRGGRVELGTRVEEVSPRGVAGPWVVVTVRDDGVGMDEATLQRVFDPFFTTKPRGEGTGLGLSTAHAIVQSSGGDIRVESAPGRGTTFEVWLPRAGHDRSAARRGQPGDVCERTPDGPATVLVVEDEPGVRRAVARVLEAEGFRVVVASGPEEALGLAVAVPELDLVLSDVVMPEMSGRELEHALRERGVRAPVAFMSGYPGGQIEGPYLAKPFTGPELVSFVGARLGGVLSRPPESS